MGSDQCWCRHTCTVDNFLSPVHYSPSTLSLDAVKTITKQTALRYPNYFMYDEDETTPTVVLMIGTALLKVFAPRQPIWRLHILIRHIEKLFGINWLKRLLFVRKKPVSARASFGKP